MNVFVFFKKKLKTSVEACFSYNIIFVNSLVSFYKEKTITEHVKSWFKTFNSKQKTQKAEKDEKLEKAE